MSDRLIVVSANKMSTGDFVNPKFQARVSPETLEVDSVAASTGIVQATLIPKVVVHEGVRAFLGVRGLGIGHAPTHRPEHSVGPPKLYASGFIKQLLEERKKATRPNAPIAYQYRVDEGPFDEDAINGVGGYFATGPVRVVEKLEPLYVGQVFDHFGDELGELADPTKDPDVQRYMNIFSEKGAGYIALRVFNLLERP